MAVDSDEDYSQGEAEDNGVPRVLDPFDDSEPSMDDDEETIADRRNWRRNAWRTYKLSNPCSILFLPEENRFIVLNEAVITFLAVDVENGRPFVQGPSKNIFCYDFDVFNRQSIQPWSIASTSTPGLFVFSLLDSAQLYSLDIRNENTIIKQFMTTPVAYCPYLLFHPQSNTLFVHDTTQVLAVSSADGTTVKLALPLVEKESAIAAMAIDKTGHVYILSGLTIFKCTWESQLHLVERLEKIGMPSTHAQMVVTGTGTEFYLADMDAGCICRWKKEST
ncbi:unnamed protein product [Didymodactylos carnosus]|uniref:Uncharacterized protein n=1 Tax=Didymodactylos carnosus TaxID=1234261 RepID=A0A8S2DB51_9BILA|nr:unnamed protein product [Didymodactylos carnosus]CAF3674833.1 unnamed protein product [Didymodactylos carnosus]